MSGQALSSAPTYAPHAVALGPHLLRALRAVVGRELRKFLRQPSRLASALVRPLLWFVVFSAGFHNVFGVAIVPPYETYIEYSVYMLPGLLGMIGKAVGDVVEVSTPGGIKAYEITKVEWL